MPLSAHAQISLCGFESLCAMHFCDHLPERSLARCGAAAAAAATAVAAAAGATGGLGNSGGRLS